MKQTTKIIHSKTFMEAVKTRKTFPILILMVFIFFQFNQASAQRIALEILDAATYRPVADAEVVFKSAFTMMTFHSSPDGSVIANVPQGEYSITVSRLGYEEKVMEGVVARMDQITRLEVLLKMKETTTTVTSRETTRPGTLPAPVVPRNFFMDIGGQIGNINAANIGVGYYFIPEAFIMLNYAFSRQQYSSLFFINRDENYRINFNRVSLKSGIDFGFKVINDIGLQFNPHMNIGFERANNKDLIDNDRIEYIMSYSFIAGMDIGVTYSRAVFYVGYNHAFWMFAAMNQERTPLENGITGETARWADDLFPGRKGRNIRIGVKLYL